MLAGLASLLIRLQKVLLLLLLATAIQPLTDAVTSVVPLLAPGLFKRTRDNFIRTFGVCQSERLARASIRNFGRMDVDFLWARALDDAEVRACTRLAHDEHLWSALQGGHGVILVLPHLGCWDMAAACASAAVGLASASCHAVVPSACCSRRCSTTRASSC
ncbi:MAG: hypothetical protein JO057_16440 [Chloroflexi bacterium]|nr:hypothetical protein [Chloroflexota bacterium]